MTVPVNTSGRVYDDFFEFPHRESSVFVLTGDLSEESDQIRFLGTDSLVNLEGSVGLFLTATSYTYSTAVAATADTTCGSCPANTVSELGSGGLVNCTCNSGSYLSLTSFTLVESSCPPSSYSFPSLISSTVSLNYK